MDATYPFPSFSIEDLSFDDFSSNDFTADVLPSTETNDIYGGMFDPNMTQAKGMPAQVYDQNIEPTNGMTDDTNHQNIMPNQVPVRIRRV